ncbi:TlpA family protein disulfide reductase [Brevibacillus dissolubilis]|uniref:TlpA family protein disulfide reductase n=1 Tax=Brevibacillus dissolubilis TaxID=1844116 RepID=UPI00159BAE89|nr:redoxin domain-containing protein [Brevibacillus dissolubilis]
MMETIVIITLLICIGQLALIYMLARYVAQFTAEIRGIKGIQVGGFEIGEIVPLFREMTPDKQKVTLRELFQTKKVLLMFVNSSCPTCKSILPSISQVIAQYNLHVVIINGDNAGDDSAITALLPSGVHYLRSPSVMETYFVTKVPHAMLIDQEGKLENQASLKDANGLWALLVQELGKVS